MGKARIAVVSDLAKESPPPYAPEVISVTTPCRPVQQQERADRAGAVVWYVISILATIFCCFPCNIIGLVHTMISKHEAEQGNISAHRRRLYQAKCWTGWSIGLGLATLIVFCILVSVCSGSHRLGRGGQRLWATDAAIDEPNYMRQGKGKDEPERRLNLALETTSATAQPIDDEFPNLIEDLMDDWFEDEDERQEDESSSSFEDESDDSDSSDDHGHHGHGRGHWGSGRGGHRGGHRGGYGRGPRGGRGGHHWD